MSDTRSRSLSEALVSSISSYPLGFSIGIIILPLSVDWLSANAWMATAAVTATYTTCSCVRIYCLRRIFTRLDSDDNFIKLGIKLCRLCKKKILNW